MKTEGPKIFMPQGQNKQPKKNQQLTKMQKKLPSLAGKTLNERMSACVQAIGSRSTEGTHGLSTMQAAAQCGPPAVAGTWTRGLEDPKLGHPPPTPCTARRQGLA